MQRRHRLALFAPFTEPCISHTVSKMKLLHTADLHLGKTLHETPLLGVQEKMLNDIHDILIRDNYAALIIAGDVYDRAIPSAEAVSLFSRFLARIREDCSDTAVFIIPGNHDSAQRLDAFFPALPIISALLLPPGRGLSSGKFLLSDMHAVS